jgi:hypothetical protein
MFLHVLAIKLHLAVHSVFADFVGGSKDFKTVAGSVAGGAILLTLGLKALRDDHRGAWSSTPIAIIRLMLGAAGGVNALRGLGINLLDFAQGK